MTASPTGLFLTEHILKNISGQPVTGSDGENMVLTCLGTLPYQYEITMWIDSSGLDPSGVFNQYSGYSNENLASSGLIKPMTYQMCASSLSATGEHRIRLLNQWHRVDDLPDTYLKRKTKYYTTGMFAKNTSVNKVSSLYETIL